MTMVSEASDEKLVYLCAVGSNAENALKESSPGYHENTAILGTRNFLKRSRIQDTSRWESEGLSNKEREKESRVIGNILVTFPIWGMKCLHESTR